MPSISAHFPDELAPVLEAAASASEQKNVGSYIRESVRQRLEREGMLPGDDRAEIIAGIDEAISIRGVDSVKTAVRKLSRKGK